MGRLACVVKHRRTNLRGVFFFWVSLFSGFWVGKAHKLNTSNYYELHFVEVKDSTFL